MVFNATFNNYIVVVSFIDVGNQRTQRKPLTCHKSLTNFITLCCIQYTLEQGHTMSHVQSNLYIMTTQGNLTMWPL